jgi:hypothetical protein
MGSFRRIGLPVRSAIHKPQIGRLVVGWVTTSEYLLLYVLFAKTFRAKVWCGEEISRRAPGDLTDAPLLNEPTTHKSVDYKAFR